MSYRLSLSLLVFLSSFALAAAEEKPEHLNYSENFGSTDEEFQRSWRGSCSPRYLARMLRVHAGGRKARTVRSLLWSTQHFLARDS
jgi:hypothetical protein